MSDYKIPIIEPTIDYTKVPPINQKRTVSFINHFITHTVTFLNKFALSCEEKLYEFENKLQKLEASLEILESRLSSIPGLEQEYHKESDNVNGNDISKSEEVEVRKVDEPDNNEIEPKDGGEKDEHAASKDPRYEKYFKMIHFGVPKQAVKLKMEQEGLDASVLDLMRNAIVTCTQIDSIFSFPSTMQTQYRNNLATSFLYPVSNPQQVVSIQRPSGENQDE